MSSAVLSVPVQASSADVKVCIVDGITEEESSDWNIHPVRGTVSYDFDSREVMFQYQMGDRSDFSVVFVGITRPAGFNVTGTHGFSVNNETDILILIWDRKTQNPSFTYKIPFQSTGASSTFEGYASTENWALVPKPLHGGNVTLDLAQEGYMGDNMIYFGNYSVESSRGGCQNIDVVVSEAATPRFDPGKVATDLANASTQLDTGPKYSEVQVFILPSDGPAGAAHSRDMWVSDKAYTGIDTLWLHEYVHTRQNYDTNEETEWFSEGSAVYYSSELSRQEGYTNGTEICQTLIAIDSSDISDNRLTEPSSWTSTGVQYAKGFLVLAALDAELRSQDGDASLKDIFWEMNTYNETITYSVFKDIIRDQSDESTVQWIENYVGSSKSPTANTYHTSCAKYYFLETDSGRRFLLMIGAVAFVLLSIVFVGSRKLRQRL